MRGLQIGLAFSKVFLFRYLFIGELIEGEEVIQSECRISSFFLKETEKGEVRDKEKKFKTCNRIEPKARSRRIGSS